MASFFFFLCGWDWFDLVWCLAGEGIEGCLWEDGLEVVWACGIEMLLVGCMCALWERLRSMETMELSGACLVLFSFLLGVGRILLSAFTNDVKKPLTVSVYRRYQDHEACGSEC